MGHEGWAMGCVWGVCGVCPSPHASPRVGCRVLSEHRQSDLHFMLSINTANTLSKGPSRGRIKGMKRVRIDALIDLLVGNCSKQTVLYNILALSNGNQ